MDRRDFLAVAALTPALSLVQQALGKEPAAAAEGTWVPIFNGKDLAGWTVKIRGYDVGDNYADTFRVEDGVIKVAYDKYDGPYRGRHGYLFYNEPLSHYKLRLEYRFVGDQLAGGPDWAVRNSGIMVHGQTPQSMSKDQNTLVSLEMQLLGGDGVHPRTTGNLCTPGTNVVYNGKLHTDHCTNSTSKTYAGDQWVKAEIEVHGGELIRHIIDGETVFEYTKPQLDEKDEEARKLLMHGAHPLLTRGTVSLQSESHPVEFRNVELMKLPAEATAGVEPTEPIERIELSDPNSFMLVALPDSQVYCAREPLNKYFYEQTDWIAENAERLNIKYVLHEGDIVNNNNRPQWEVAAKAMKRLDGVVPYALAPGNHDYGENGSTNDRSTFLNEYFSADECAKWPTFGGVRQKGRLESSYHAFEAGGNKYLILALEWGPRDETVAWADEIVSQHPDHRVILVTHAYMYFDETRYDWKKRGKLQTWNPHAYPTANLPGGTNDGEQLWDKLVKRHPGFIMTLNGHVLNDGAGRMVSRGDHGNTVHQMLANYQMKPEGGEGYMRLLEFLPDGETVIVRSYSPSAKRIMTSDEQQFKLKLTPPT